MRRIINHIRLKGFKYILNPKRLLGFFKAKKNEVTGINLSPEEVDSFVEQYLLRKYLCKPCFDKGECLYCGCEAQGLMTQKTDTQCGYEEEVDGVKEEYPRWKDMMTPERWADYKTVALRNIEFGVIIKKEKEDGNGE